MKVRTAYIPLGHPNRPGEKALVKGIVVHYTANFNPTAGDEMHARYVSRDWEIGTYYRYDKQAKAWVKETGPIESGSMGKGRGGLGEQFRKASAHVFVDQDSATWTIPAGEVAWHCGDRNLPWDKRNKGQTPLARVLFANRQNYATIGVEICANADWARACANAQELIAQLLAEYRLNEKQVLRHWDLTAKLCPKRFVEHPEEWQQFLAGIEEQRRRLA